MPSIQDIMERIDEAVSNGETAFWDSIAESFPEINSGEFPVDADAALKQVLSVSVIIWIYSNCHDYEL